MDRQPAEDLIAAVDAAFAAGDADAYAALFANDARLLLQFQPEPIEGRIAIARFMRGFFTAFDTSDWAQHVELMDEVGDRALLLTTYAERLLERESGNRELIRGRLVYWLRSEDRGAWRIKLLVNSQSHVPEPIP